MKIEDVLHEVTDFFCAGVSNCQGLPKLVAYAIFSIIFSTIRALRTTKNAAKNIYIMKATPDQ